MSVCGPSTFFHALNESCPCLKSHNYVVFEEQVYCKECFKRFTLQPMSRCSSVLHVMYIAIQDNCIQLDCLECNQSTMILVDYPIISPIYIHQMGKDALSTLERCIENTLKGESRPLNKSKIEKKIKSPILNELLLLIGYELGDDEYLLKNIYESNCLLLLTYLKLINSNTESKVMGLSYFIDGLSMVYDKSKQVPLTDYVDSSVSPAYRELGCIDFPDELIIFAFHRHLHHTKNLIKYTSLLFTIGNGRESQELLLQYYKYKKYVDAFNFFGTSNSNELDTFYIGLYSIKLSDSPQEAQAAKKYLQFIGEFIESFTILSMCHNSDDLTGLGNSGVSCHLNACLQCLAHIEPFRTTLLLQQNEISQLLIQLFNEMSTRSFVFPNQQLITLLFGAAQQQDASECLEKILDQIGPLVCQSIFEFKCDNESGYMIRLDANTPIVSIQQKQFDKYPQILLIQINVIHFHVAVIF